MVSNMLLSVLRTAGYARVAKEAMALDGEFTQGLDTLEGIAKSAAVRFLVDEANLAEIVEGIASLEALGELK